MSGGARVVSLAGTGWAWVGSGSIGCLSLCHRPSIVGIPCGRTARRWAGVAAASQRALGCRNHETDYTLSVRDLTEVAVAARVPTLVDEKLKVLSRRDPIQVKPGTSLAGCLVMIQQAGTGDSVFVTDAENRLVGVLTERDIFGRIVGEDVDLEQPVESMMTTKPQHLHPDEKVGDAIALMQTGRYRNVPLLDDEDHLVGVVRPQDLIKYLAEAFPEELLNLPPRPHQKMEKPEGG